MQGGTTKLQLKQLGLEKMTTKGQNLALEQLARISHIAGSTFDVYKTSGVLDNDQIEVGVKVNCSQYEKKEGGLTFREFEKFIISIPKDFPFKAPSIKVPHKRFSGFNHVQWSRCLCLYQAPDFEWSSTDGMYGYIERLSLWLKKAALNSHEGYGEALHPPAIYSVNKELPLIVPQSDTPEVIDKLWLGFAELQSYNDNNRFDITNWVEPSEFKGNSIVAPAILLPNSFPFEYPLRGKDLFKQIYSLGIDEDLLNQLLLCSILTNPDDTHLFLIIGTAMRGVVGEKLEQHLATWFIPKDVVSTFKLILKAERILSNTTTVESYQEVLKIAEDCKGLAKKHLHDTNLSWCVVEENRPQVVRRRDINAPVSWFDNKTVSVWGCGALGSYIAEIAVRAGAAKIILRDNKKVNPGILVRQNYLNDDIGLFKVEALKRRLLGINPNIEIIPLNGDIMESLDPEMEEISYRVDLIINSSASKSLSLKIEEYLVDNNIDISIASMIVDQNANSAILTLSNEQYSGSVYDIHRKAKILSNSISTLSSFSEEFWPDKDSVTLFQPIPGCSDPTFIGSSADIMSLSAHMCNVLCGHLNEENPLTNARVNFINTSTGSPKGFNHLFESDFSIKIEEHYDVRIEPSALKEMKDIIKNSKTIKKKVCETGGLLFGQINDAAGVIWISKFSPPPKDSESTPELFVCGTDGTKELNNEVIAKSKGSASYIGMWHTHPVSAAIPSATDLKGMATIICQDEFSPNKQLLLIVGNSSEANIEMSVSVFSRENIYQYGEKKIFSMTKIYKKVKIEGGI